MYQEGDREQLLRKIARYKELAIRRAYRKSGRCADEPRHCNIIVASLGEALSLQRTSRQVNIADPDSGARRSPGGCDCIYARSVVGLWRAFAALSCTRPPLDRSISNVPDADPRLRLRPAVGAFACGLQARRHSRSFSWCGGLLRWKDKDLARIDPVGIADLVPVRPVNDCVASARAICDAA